MNKTGKYGFTLVEIMIAAAIASLVGTVAFNVWRYANAHMSRTMIRQTMQSDARRIITYLKADLKAAKADSFPAEGSDNEISFKRYANIKEQGQEKAKNKLVEISYKFVKPMLMRKANGLEKVLSTKVDSIEISRKELSKVQQENEKYLEARVDIALVLKAKVPGTLFEETFTEHTSAVIREEYYAKEYEERKDIVSVISDPAETPEDTPATLDEAVINNIDSDEESVFFADELSAEELAKLEPKQLDSLKDAHEETFNQCKEQLEGINDQISDVEGGQGFFQWLFGANKDGAEVDNFKKQLKKIKDPTKPPAKQNDPLSSDEAAKISDDVKAKIDVDEEDFMKIAFGADYIAKSEYEHAESDSEQQREAKDEKRQEADFMRTAYNKKLTDKLIKDAKEKQKEQEEEQKAKENKDGGANSSDGQSGSNEQSGSDGQSGSNEQSGSDGQNGSENADTEEETKPISDPLKTKYDDYSQSMSRSEIREMMYNDLSAEDRASLKGSDSDDFEERVDKATHERERIQYYYNKCEIDKIETKNDKYEAYEGLKCLKTLADSKAEMCRLMELKAQNMQEIDDAKAMQKK